MTHEDQLLDKAINIYLTGLKGIESFISEPASEYNLSFEQFLILRKIINHPNIKLMDIAEQRQVTRSAVSRQLKVLFQQKYVEQKADPADRRRMFLVATKKGKVRFGKGLITALPIGFRFMVKIVLISF